MTGTAATGERLLVVVDLQKIFADPESGWFAPRFEEILEAVDRLVEACSPSVLFTRFVSPLVPQGAWKSYYERYPFALIPPEDPGYELVDRYRAHAASSVETTTFSKWVPEVVAALVPGATLVLAGVTTDCCVLATALAAADAGVAVEVVPEGCAGADDASHERALALLGSFSPLIEIVPLAEATNAAAEATRITDKMKAAEATDTAEATETAETPERGA